MTPVVISSDKGSEWTGAVQTLLDQKDVVHRVKIRGDENSLAVVDRVIQNIKKRLAESLAKTPGEWYTRVRDVEQEYNATPHETLHDEPPDEVMLAGRKTLRFILDQDNAKKLQHNQELLEGRTRQLEQAGAFRRPLEGRNTFKRSFKASYGAMEQLDSIRGSTVAPVGGGAPIDIKRVLPVDRETQDVRPSFALGDARAEDRRQRVALLANSLYDFLRDDEKSMASAAAHLKRDLGDEQYSLQLRSVGAQSLSDVVRLIGDLELTRNGNYVRARRT